MDELPVMIVPESPDDHGIIEQMNGTIFGAARFTRAAFLIREHCGHDLSLSLVAKIKGKIVGSLRQTKIAIGSTPALLLGPLVVSESYKNIGIGGKLMRRAAVVARERGHDLILLVGDQSYYARFDFQPVGQQKIILPAPADPCRILACELKPGLLQQLSGRVRPLHDGRMLKA